MTNSDEQLTVFLIKAITKSLEYDCWLGD